MECEHCHNHAESVKEQIYFVFSIVFAVIFFIGGFFWQPLFIVSYLVSGIDIILRAFTNIIHGEIFDENFLMTTATVGALIIEEYPEAAMVMILYKIGEYLQNQAIYKSRESIESLINIRPDYAFVNGERKNPKDVKKGDIITVNSGDKIPLDGVVLEGFAQLDLSALTGESLPVEIKQGDKVLSGSINLNGVLRIKVTAEYEQSTATKIIELIRHSADKKAKAENFITKFAKIYTPMVVLLSVFIAFVFPLLFPNINWIERALTFLVISCPCALVISIPLSFFAGIGKASSYGILIKGGNFIETLAKTKTIVFDKTGTLTNGKLEVCKINSEHPDILKYAAIAEAGSSHPVAKAIKIAYGGEILQANSIKEFAGKGIEVVFEDKKIKVGRYDYIGVQPVNENGITVYVSINDDYIGNIVLSDNIREDSFITVEKLSKMNIKTVMLTGDSNKNANNVKEQLGIETAYSELLPNDKVRKIEELMSKNSGNVAFVGDGINDAPVLKRADAGLAMGGIGSDTAIEASDIVIMDDKLSRIITAIGISKKTLSVVKQNISFAIGIKVLFLFLGCLGFISMWGAIFADVGVTLLTILNSLQLKTYKE